MARADMDEEDKIPSKPAALRKIASATAALIGAGGLDDLFGYTHEDWTQAEMDRLYWAVEEVQRRLWEMGEPRRRSSRR
jgi:hypothetical protein